MMAASSGEGGRFYAARLAERSPAGGGLTVIVVDAPEVATASYRSPGQYVEVRAGDAGEAGYFVLASEPGARPWELIMRSGGGASDVLLVAPLGTDILVTAAIGAGFPLERARGAPLVVALGGTGIAAGRPIVRRRIRDGDAERTTVLVGARTRAEVALESDLREWSAARVAVTVCLSQPEGAAPSDGVVHGYVQDALRRLDPRPGVRTLVFAVGPASMIAALRAAAPAAGIDHGDVLTNH